MACTECLACIECFATGDENLTGPERTSLSAALRRFHVNLGHASVPGMIRILKHAGAKEHVLALVRNFSCDVCNARADPRLPRTAAVPHNLAPFRYVGMDVKHLPGWQPGQRFKALNIVDQTSSLQRKFPFFEMRVLMY